MQHPPRSHTTRVCGCFNWFTYHVSMRRTLALTPHLSGVHAWCAWNRSAGVCEVCEVRSHASQSPCVQGMHVHVGLSLVTPAFFTLCYMLAAIIQPSPLYEPQYSIPLMGMMLGNSLTGVTVGVKTLLETMSAERAAVEWRLCMGATRWEAVACVLLPPCASVLDLTSRKSLQADTDNCLILA